MIDDDEPEPDRLWPWVLALLLVGAAVFVVVYLLTSVLIRAGH